MPQCVCCVQARLRRAEIGSVQRSILVRQICPMVIKGLILNGSFVEILNENHMPIYLKNWQMMWSCGLESSSFILKTSLSSTLSYGWDICPRVDNQTSGDTLQEWTLPLRAVDKGIHRYTLYSHLLGSYVVLCLPLEIVCSHYLSNQHMAYAPFYLQLQHWDY